MEVYLIRHTTPDVAKGVCYGQTDLELVSSYDDEVEVIQKQIPDRINAFYSSPLKRCTVLAARLSESYETDDRLKEISFGDWEMKCWDDIEEAELTSWMNDFVNVSAPRGESMQMLSDRVLEWWDEVQLKHQNETIVVITHAGVIRVLLSHVNNSPLKASFKDYPLAYGQLAHVHLG